MCSIEWLFPMTLGDLYAQTTPIFAFFVAFHIFVVSKHRDFTFGWGGLKFITFDEKRTITRERYKIEA